VILDLGSHGGGKSGLDGLDLLVLDLGVLVRAEDLDDLSSGLLGSGRELGNVGAGLIGVGSDVRGQAGESVEVLIVRVGVGSEVVDGCDADSLGDGVLDGVDLSEDVRGEGVLDGLALLPLGLGVLVGAEDLDDLSGGLLGGGRKSGDTGAGLLGVGLDVLGELLESLKDLA
ncbi:hypothetical protein PFISCL1PPCAC_22588, partial [Pristionchus fissidentatus]